VEPIVTLLLKFPQLVMHEDNVHVAAILKVYEDILVSRLVVPNSVSKHVFWNGQAFSLSCLFFQLKSTDLAEIDVI